ncbi:riboflavin-aldehyde forming enzyme [Artomyces pyxidatus]|uniref:Riboflavin-aldehyde forming enzyme n=1 Tax=Artomyces pyxidatus TaxID=48021 RepID=A0ACB8SNV3_9AGAM|nr:riboflavin-aldehyde forming enzyme [Artomyces pyxidatus]
MFRATLSLLLVALFGSLFALASPIEKRQLGGRGTWFDVGLGACGLYNVDSDFIVALATPDYAGGAHCNQMITITANGQTASAQVRDECPSCNSGSIDMSPGLFQQFASLDVGVVEVSWNYD